MLPSAHHGGVREVAGGRCAPPDTAWQPSKGTWGQGRATQCGNCWPTASDQGGLWGVGLPQEHVPAAKDCPEVVKRAEPLLQRGQSISDLRLQCPVTRQAFLPSAYRWGN